MKSEFDYYYGAEAEQFSFIKIPKVLFSDKKHFGKLSIGAKMMYGLLLDRMSLIAEEITGLTIRTGYISCFP